MWFSMRQAPSDVRVEKTAPVAAVVPTAPRVENAASFPAVTALVQRAEDKHPAPLIVIASNVVAITASVSTVAATLPPTPEPSTTSTTGNPRRFARSAPEPWKITGSAPSKSPITPSTKTRSALKQPRA